MKKSSAEIMKERLAGQPPIIRCVEIGDKPVSMITFSLWGAGDWSLPWSRLEAIRYLRSGKQGGERVEIEFSRHLVVASGDNLAGLIDDLHEAKMWLLRDLPPIHRVGFEPGVPFISRLEVRSLE